MTNRELGATILMLGAECKDLKGEEAKELLTQVEAEITNHIKDQLKNGVLHSVSDIFTANDVERAYYDGLNDDSDLFSIKNYR